MPHLHNFFSESLLYLYRNEVQWMASHLMLLRVCDDGVRRHSIYRTLIAVPGLYLTPTILSGLTFLTTWALKGSAEQMRHW